MAHRVRVRSASDPWASILPSEMALLDAGIAAGINGVDGGTWAPATPIVIGVSGMRLMGPAVIARGGSVVTPSDTSTRTQPTIFLADGDWPQLDPVNPLATRPVTSSLCGARGIPMWTWTARRETGGIQAYSPMFDPSDGYGQRVSRAYVRIRAHDTATIASVRVRFRVGFAHTALPTKMPSVRVVRQDEDGACSVLTSQAAGADPDGFVYVPTPSSAAAWTNNLQPQELVVPCDQNNVVDVGSYSYFLELVEEQGLTGYPWQLTYTIGAIVATTGPITLSGAQTIDGQPVGVGDTVLVKDQFDQTQNGLYVVESGTWARWIVLGTAAQFSQGLVVPIVVGATTVKNSNTLWQVLSSITSWTPDKTPLIFQPKPDAAYPVENSGFIPHGIIWQDVAAKYTGIASLRFQ